MDFRRIEPTGHACKAIDYYWLAKDDNSTCVKQKIIPDGFAEIIFHFGDQYRINLHGRWQRQGRRLLAGQLTKYFYLENTGVSDMMGIKLKPAAVTHLFGISMKDLVDRVVVLDEKIKIDTENVDEYFNRLCVNYPCDHPADKAVEIILSKKGMITVAELCSEIDVSERYVQTLFQKYVGLSPKFFSRVIRFSHIFNLIKEHDPDWAEVVYKAGYYDQSHFIRNFKAFTGEDPGEYLFAEKTLANFFMKRLK
jgi:AraC-like DNA-binding protein